MSSPTRRPGRPRDATIDEAIVAAVFDLIEEVGLAPVTIDAIAERAGVSKATIYRRWATKDDLVVDAVAGLIGRSLELPASGDIRAVLVAVLRQMESFMSMSVAGSIFPWLVGEVAAGTEIGRHYAAAVIIPRRADLGTLIRQAIERGELRADLDVETALDLIIGPVIVRKLMGRWRQPEEDWVPKLVDGLLAGWAP